MVVRIDWVYITFPAIIIALCTFLGLVEMHIRGITSENYRKVLSRPVLFGEIDKALLVSKSIRKQEMDSVADKISVKVDLGVQSLRLIRVSGMP